MKIKIPDNFYGNKAKNQPKLRNISFNSYKVISIVKLFSKAFLIILTINIGLHTVNCSSGDQNQKPNPSDSRLIICEPSPLPEQKIKKDNHIFEGEIKRSSITPLTAEDVDSCLIGCGLLPPEQEQKQKKDEDACNLGQEMTEEQFLGPNHDQVVSSCGGDSLSDSSLSKGPNDDHLGQLQQYVEIFSKTLKPIDFSTQNVPIDSPGNRENKRKLSESFEDSLSKSPNFDYNDFSTNKETKRHFTVKDFERFIETKKIELDDVMRFEIEQFYRCVENAVKESIKKDLLFDFIDWKYLFEEKLKKLKNKLIAAENNLENEKKSDQKKMENIENINSKIKRLQRNIREFSETEDEEKKIEVLLDPKVTSYFLHSIFYEFYFSKRELIKDNGLKENLLPDLQRLIVNLILFARANILMTNYRINDLLIHKLSKSRFSLLKKYTEFLKTFYLPEYQKIPKFIKIDKDQVLELIKDKLDSYLKEIAYSKNNICVCLITPLELSQEKRISIYSSAEKKLLEYDDKRIIEIKDALGREDLYVLNDCFSALIEKKNYVYNLVSAYYDISKLIDLLISIGPNKIYCIEHIFHVSEMKILNYIAGLGNIYSSEAAEKLGQVINYFYLVFIIKGIRKDINIFNSKKCLFFLIPELKERSLLFIEFIDCIEKRKNYWDKFINIIKSIKDLSKKAK